jgi:hypothetical protein
MLHSTAHLQHGGSSDSWESPMYAVRMGRRLCANGVISWHCRHVALRQCNTRSCVKCTLGHVRPNFTVVTETRYCLDCLGIELWWGRHFSNPSRGPPTLLLGTGSSSWKQGGRSVVFTTHPHLAQWLKKEHSYTSNSTPRLSLYCLF